MENDIFSIDENGNLIMTTYVDYPIIDEAEYETICDYIDGLPNSTPFDRVRTDEGIFTDWDFYAKKGITAYDNYYGDNPILTSKPVYPLTITDIPTEILVLIEKYS